jgi:predicted GNAT family acetyltransferase
VPDDWRLTVDLDDEGDGTQLVEWLAALRVERDERARLGDRVIVSRDGSCVFLYADAEETVRQAETVVRTELSGRGLGARLALERWHPAEQEWKDVSVPLPRTDEELAAERARRQEREAEHSRETGHAEWEVRVELPSREETVRLAERLDAEGVPVVRRSTFLLAGAANEDDAIALAERLQPELPVGARVEVEPGGGMVWEVMPENPFAVFGGLGA